MVFLYMHGHFIMSIANNQIIKNNHCLQCRVILPTPRTLYRRMLANVVAKAIPVFTLAQYSYFRIKNQYYLFALG